MKTDKFLRIIVCCTYLQTVRTASTIPHKQSDS
uniref:Uncharacterized protein n=1 Tax=Arundo donax TaxID=35708 RepID=A0A0A9GVM1_ARUDO